MLSVVATDRSENLKRLLEECRQDLHTAGLDLAGNPQSINLARSLPLTHARTSSQFVNITTDVKRVGNRIFSPKKVAELFGIPVRPSSAEASLNTQQFVFLYCGQFRYPETQVGFLFGKTLEDENSDASEASPFDSGALHKYATWPDARESGAAFLARHSLQVPEYRDYLAFRLDYLFFRPTDYLAPGEIPIRPDPIGLRPNPPAILSDPRLWTFEVRVLDEVQLAPPHLLAIFYSSRLLSAPSVVEFLAAQSKSIHIEELFAVDDESFVSLQLCCLNYLRDRGIIS